MKNEEIYGFVNSKDIRDYLISTGYEFSTAEAAWLVSQCRKITLNEKIAAWERIISSMPDMKINDRCFTEYYERLHEVLRDYVSLVRESLDLFMNEDPKVIYQYKIDYIDDYGSYDRKMSFSSYESCLSQLKSELSDDSEAYYGTIRRSIIDSSETVTAEYNREALITHVEIPSSVDKLHHNLSDFFDRMWFHFPVPFQKGDILYDAYHLCPCGPQPVVMTDITPLMYEADRNAGCDTSDMNVFGYFQNSESGIIYHDVAWNYMDYEYYPEENLKGVRLILKAVSSFIKNKIPLDTLMYVYHKIVLEEAKNNVQVPFSLTDEEKEACGKVV